MDWINEPTNISAASTKGYCEIDICDLCIIHCRFIF